MNVSTILLYPFAILYHGITATRNRLFDLALRPSASFETPVISVGNLTVGGTGKTPMIEHLIRTLSPRFQIATLSRGYKRSTKGFRIANAVDTPATIGDEPFQFWNKFGEHVTVAVGEERAMAIPQILQDRPNTQLVLLDDAFQHRQVTPHFQILLSDYHRPFYSDFLLPAGRLRESKFGSSRANVIVVTKCPSTISDDEMLEIQKNISLYSDKPVFFSTVHYGDLIGSGTFDRKAVLVSGLADPTSFEQYARQNLKLVQHFRYADHHLYSVNDVNQIVKTAREHGAAIVTTEKDWVKLKAFEPQFGNIPLLYVPIEINFIKNGKEFDEMVINAITDASK